jgi:hypothetical protein
MKNKIIKMAFCIFVLLGCVSKPSSPVFTSGNELDVAIREASDYLNDNVPVKSKIVILNFQSEYPSISEYIIEVLIANAIDDKIFTIADRQQLDQIRAELNFQMSGEVSDESAQEIGRMMGAQTIVSGAVSRIGNLYRLRVRAINVETATIQGQFNRNISDNPTLVALAMSNSSSGAGTKITQTGNKSGGNTAAQASLTLAYKIGDTGPAGGLIFYDKGKFSDGWRYMEVAPSDLEFQATWSNKDISIEGTKNGIGFGKQNTQLICDVLLKISGEWDQAAQRCDELDHKGFDDWFLPSIDELNLIYGNLKRNDLGDFKDDSYWSSTFKGQDWPYYVIYTFHFDSGKSGQNDNNRNLYVRPVRSF